MSSVAWDYVLKFIIIGDSGVGKSSLLVRLTDRRFLANPDPTLGVEFGSKLIELQEEGKVIKLQCWDTAGTEAFRSITRSYYRGAAGALLVFDVTSRASFTNARSWLQDIRAHADPHLTCVLIANKLDLCEDETQPSSSEPNDAASIRTSTSRARRRQVSREEAELWAKEEGLLFLEASAKTGENVDEAFDQAARDILAKIQKGMFDDKNNKNRTAKPARTTDPNQLTLEEGRKSTGTCC